MLQLQDGPQPLQSASYRTELLACWLNEDLIGLKGLLPGIDAQAERFPGLVVLRHVMHSRYHQFRGDLDRALSELEPALRIVRAGMHADWVFAVSAHVELLELLGRPDEALEHAENYLAVADAEAISRAKWLLEHAAVKALLALGRLDEARSRCEALVAARVDEGVSGTALALAQETRARIALAEGDAAGLKHWVAAHAQHFEQTNNPIVRALHQRLLREVSGAPVDLEMPDTQLSTRRADVSTTVQQRLSELADPAERARGALMILLETMQRRRGFLFGFRQGKFQCLSGIPDEHVPEDVVSALERLAVAETSNAGVTVTAGLTQTESPQHEMLANLGIEPLMLTVQRDLDVVLVAAAAIEQTDDTSTFVDGSLLRALSEALIDFADVDPVTCVA